MSSIVLTGNITAMTIDGKVVPLTPPVVVVPPVVIPPVIIPPTSGSFAAAVLAAWAADSVLNWTGGDATLSAPIVLSATSGKNSFGLRMNGAKITSAFNDATKYALTINVPVTNGVVPQGITVRNFQIVDGNFMGTNFAGAVKLECLSNGSWIYSWLLSNLKCEGHTGRAFALVGSVFEGVSEKLTTTGGVGAMWIETRGVNGTVADTDWGLPSALYLYSPNFRDGSGHAIEMACVKAYNEPFDLTVRDGYIVTYGGNGIKAPSGITCVDGTGFENLQGGAAINLGYRGGLIKQVRGANPTANSTPTSGMMYLVDTFLAGGTLLLEDCSIQNENAGTGSRLARIAGSGKVYMNRSGTASALDGSGPVITVQS